MWKTKTTTKIISQVFDRAKRSLDEAIEQMDQHTAELDKIFDEVEATPQPSRNASRAKQIQTIVSSNPKDFDERVNAALSSGWILDSTTYSPGNFIAILYKTRTSK